MTPIRRSREVLGSYLGRGSSPAPAVRPAVHKRQEESMRRFVLALVASLGLATGASLGAAADISLTQNTQVTLSCSDGHSVSLYVDSTTLTSLTADINSINLSGGGLTCGLDTAAIDPSTES